MIFKQQLKRFFSEKLLLILTSLFFGITLILAGGVDLINIQHMMALSALENTLMFSYYSIIFFLFISYEYLSKIKKSYSYEIISVTKNGLLKYYLSGIGVLSLLLGVYTAIHTLFNFFAGIYIGVMTAQYALHIVSNMLVFMFLAPFAGIMLGACLSFLNKRASAYFAMVMFVLLSSEAFMAIGTQVYADAGISLFPLIEFFRFYPDYFNKWGVLPEIGSVILPYNIAVIFAWILSALLFVLFKLSNTKPVLFKAVALLCTAAIVLNVYVYLMPASKIGLTINPVYGSVSDDIYYQDLRAEGKFPQEEELPDFQIVKYKMKIRLKSTMSVETELTLSENELNEYKFTLYHEYKVSLVTDFNSIPLKYTQSLDSLTVTSDKPLTTVKINYTGSAPRYFANYQCASLPAFFPYYPFSGHRAIYNFDLLSFNPLTPDYADFDVTVESPNKVYSNLDSESQNRFLGKATGMTLILGMYECAEFSGVEVVYPYLESTKVSPVAENIEQAVSDFIKTCDKDKKFKKILIFPNANLRAINETFAAYDDCIATTSIYSLSEDYQNNLLGSDKLSLQDVLKLYKENYALYKAQVDVMTSRLDKTDTENDYLYLFYAACEKYGDDYVAEETVKYINNSSDTRSVKEFFSELGEVNA